MCTRALIALLLVSSACANAGAVQTIRVQRPDVQVAPVLPPVVHPLTGRTYYGEQDWESRPVLAIKVENSRQSRPQSGLDRADIVYEELAEGGVTRFIAFFHTSGAEPVGPVRSARMMDPHVVAPTNALFAYAGAVPPVIAAVRTTSGVVDAGYDRVPAAYYRRGDRRAPHNLYTSTQRLWGSVSSGSAGPLFAHLPEGHQPPPSAPGSEVTFTFSSRSEQTRYAYDAAEGVYRRFHAAAAHTLEGGGQVSPVNVVIQVVSIARGTVVDTNGEVSPETRVIGEGEAIVLTGGYSYRGRWSKPSASAPTRFTDVAGNPLPLQPGQTWVELLPSGQPLRVS